MWEIIEANLIETIQWAPGLVALSLIFDFLGMVFNKK